MKFHPLSDHGIAFSIRTINYCNLSLSKCNENEQFTCFGRPMSDLQGSILSLTGSILGLRGPNLGPRGTLESKVREKDSCHIWEGPTRPWDTSMANFTHLTGAVAAPLPRPFSIDCWSTALCIRCLVSSESKLFKRKSTSTTFLLDSTPQAPH